MLQKIYFKELKVGQLLVGLEQRASLAACEEKKPGGWQNCPLMLYHSLYVSEWDQFQGLSYSNQRESV